MRTSPSRARTAALAALFSLLGGSAIAELHAPTANTDAPMDSVREALLLRWPQSPRSRDQVVEELRRLGADAVPALFGVYTGEGYEELLGEQAGAEAWWTSPDRFGPLVFDALAGCEARTVVDHLEPYATGDAAIELRLAAARVLGRLGAVEGLTTLLSMSADLGPTLVQYQSVRSTLTRALAGVLARDADAAVEASKQIETLDDETLALLLEACELSGRPGCLQVLVAALGRDADQDAKILVLCAKLAARSPWYDEVDVRELVRDRLGSRQTGLVRAAAAGSSLMQEPDSIPELIALLGDPRAGVEMSALWALRHMSGTDYGTARVDWEDWFAFQESAWEAGIEDWEGAIEHGSAGEARNAVRQLGLFRLRRHEAALVLARAVARPEPDVRRFAHIALRELGSPAAIPALVMQLPGAEDATLEELFETLEAVDDRDPPRELAAWQRRVEG